MEPQWVGCAQENFHHGRPLGMKPEAIVIHIIVGSLESAKRTFLDPTIALKRSAHYGVGKSGEVQQYVIETDTAFHAGIVDRPSWKLIKPGVNPNYYTLGLEHEGLPDDIWPEAQYAASATLVSEVANRWRIPIDPDHVIMHREVRASKTCPGFKMDMNRLRQLASQIDGVRTPLPAGNFHVTTIANVNLRRGAASTTAPIVRVIPAQTTLDMKAFTAAGQAVNGNRFWYNDAEGNFVWAGATNQPHPAGP